MDEPAPRLNIRITLFPGTDRERDDLLAAVTHHCACQPGLSAHPDPCGSHDLLLVEATLKRLVFYRRFSTSLRRAEWLEAPGWTDDQAD